jgi:hypothetical protein
MPRATRRVRSTRATRAHSTRAPAARRRAACGALLLLAALLGPGRADAIDIKYLLANSGVDTDAIALARFQTIHPRRQRFEVKVSLMAPGRYAVAVDDTDVDTFLVDDGGDGRFRLQGNPLCIDPRGQPVSVKAPGAGGTTYFRSTLPAARGDDEPLPGATGPVEAGTVPAPCGPEGRLEAGAPGDGELAPPPPADEAVTPKATLPGRVVSAVRSLLRTRSSDAGVQHTP